MVHNTGNSEVSNEQHDKLEADKNNASVSSKPQPVWPVIEPRLDFSQSPDTVTIFFYVKSLLPQDIHVSRVPDPAADEAQAEDEAVWTNFRFLAHDARNQVTYEKYIKLHRPVRVPYERLKVSHVKIEICFLKSEAGLQWPRLETLSSSPSVATSSAKSETVHQIDGIPCSPNAAAAGTHSRLSKLSDMDAASTVSLAGSVMEAQSVPPLSTDDAGASAATTTPAERAAPLLTGKRRDWDKLERDVIQEEEKEEPEGEAAAMKLFKKIYADGNEETRKAMMKSYYESGGTCLSTNWEDIGKRQVDVSPPDSMEFKKWDA